MGKGYNNFMSKKAFHPGSFANQKRIHEAEEKAEAKRKHDEETLAQYQKEQELFHQKSLVSKQSKEKLSLNFMYEAPPGINKADDKKKDKVEWTETPQPSCSKRANSSGPINEINVIKDTAENKKTVSTNICLEWKRDRPVNKMKHETKEEIKKEYEIKKEHSVDLQWARKSSNDRRIKQGDNHNSEDNTKRIKKEL